MGASRGLPDNTMWQEYQAWLAADPENNIPQEEGV
jgi:hypothetical protein